MQASSWGYDVLEAGDADEAISLISLHPDVRLVLTDVDMPGSMDGVKLAHYVRDRWPPIALIVVSGKLAIEQSQLPIGARFFGKPFRDEVIQEAISELTS